MSPWVRLDENAIDHPKFLALSDGAWRLWCEGQTYCQKHLTDGRIGAAALKRFRYFSPVKVKNLVTVFVEGKGACWNLLPNGDIQVHDYLVWNESKEEVLKARSDAKDRRKRWAEKNGVRNGIPDASETLNVPCGVGTSGSVLQKKREDSSEPFDSFDPEFSPGSLERRASDFLERYKVLHVRLRKGAHYVGKLSYGGLRENADFQEAKGLVAVYDDARLDKLAYVWLNTDHDFAVNGTRTLAKFRSMASWCEEKLIDWEQAHGELKVAP